MMRFLKYFLAMLLPIAAWIAISLALMLKYNVIVFWALIIGSISCGTAVIASRNKYLAIMFLPSILWILWVVLSTIRPWAAQNILFILFVIFILPASGLIALLLRWFDKRKNRQSS